MNLPPVDYKGYWGTIALHCWEIMDDSDESGDNKTMADAVLHALAAQGFNVFDYKPRN